MFVGHIAGNTRRAGEDALEPAGRAQTRGNNESAGRMMLLLAADGDDISCGGMGFGSHENIVYPEQCLAVVQPGSSHGHTFDWTTSLEYLRNDFWDIANLEWKEDAIPAIGIGID